MALHFSNLASRFVAQTGTRLLMDDLGEVLESDRDICRMINVFFLLIIHNKIIL